MSIYKLLADAVVVIHGAYIAFVILALLLILVGRLLGWKWVRNFWFRTIHLLMIAIVVAQALWGILCPLTTLEKHLLVKAGLEPYPRSFIGECVHNLIFYEAEPWVFTVCYCAFGAVVLATFVLVPPRWPPRKRGAKTEASGDTESPG
jgi:hypothetical protein